MLCQPPWHEDELAVKIANAYNYAQDQAGKLTPEALGFEATQVVPSNPQIGGKVELKHPADALKAIQRYLGE